MSALPSSGARYTRYPATSDAETASHPIVIRSKPGITVLRFAGVPGLTASTAKLQEWKYASSARTWKSAPAGTEDPARTRRATVVAVDPGCRSPSVAVESRIVTAAPGFRRCTEIPRPSPLPSSAIVKR